MAPKSGRRSTGVKNNEWLCGIVFFSRYFLQPTLQVSVWKTGLNLQFLRIEFLRRQICMKQVHRISFRSAKPGSEIARPRLLQNKLLPNWGDRRPLNSLLFICRLMPCGTSDQKLGYGENKCQEQQTDGAWFCSLQLTRQNLVRLARETGASRSHFNPSCFVTQLLITSHCSCG